MTTKATPLDAGPGDRLSAPLPWPETARDRQIRISRENAEERRHQLVLEIGPLEEQPRRPDLPKAVVQELPEPVGLV